MKVRNGLSTFTWHKVMSQMRNDSFDVCDISVTLSRDHVYYHKNELEIRFFFFLNRSKSRRAALASCKSGSALIQKMDYHENRSRDTDHVIPSVEGIMWQKSNMKPYSKISFEMCEIVKIENSSVHMVPSYINFFMAMLSLSFWLFTNKLE